MESSVRYVQLPNAGQKPALCFRGSKSAYAIINEGGKIRSVEIDLKDYDRSVHVKSTKNGGEDYSPLAFREAVLRIIERAASSVTVRAQVLLDKGMYLKPDEVLPEEESMPMPKNDEEETVEVGVDDEGDVTINGKSYKNAELEELRKDKPKVRKLPKRINREGKAEEVPPRKTTETGGAKRLNGGAGTPRSVDRTSRPMPIAPLPSKAAGPAKGKTEAKASRGGSSKTLVAALAAELGITQQACRVKLRATGMRAPYDEKNETACRKALNLSTKGKK